jgi:hypothetical protein
MASVKMLDITVQFENSVGAIFFFKYGQTLIQKPLTQRHPHSGPT